MYFYFSQQSSEVGISSSHRLENYDLDRLNELLQFPIASTSVELYPGLFNQHRTAQSLPILFCCLPKWSHTL